MLLIHGREDKAIPIGNSEKLNENSEKIRLVKWDNCGHMPQEEYPEDFVREIVSFFGV